MVAGPIKRYQQFLPKLRAELPQWPQDWQRGTTRILAGLAKKFAIADMGDQHPAESPLEKARGDRDPVCQPPQALHQPCPRKTGGVGEIEGTADGAPRPAAQEEAHLPVVDVEEHRPMPGEPGQIADAGAREPRLGGVEQVSVG